MKALVIGASGFLGRCLTRTLVANGIEQLGTSFTRPGPQLEQLDLREAEAVRSLITSWRPDVILVAADVPAARRRELTKDDSDARALIVGGAEAAARAATNLGALVVLYSPPTVFAGPDSHGEDEATDPSSGHGALKAEAEAILKREAPRHLIVRTGEVYGWDRTADDLVQRLDQRVRGGGTLPASEQRTVQPTLVDYLAEATLRLIQTETTGTVHIAG